MGGEEDSQRIPDSAEGQGARIGNAGSRTSLAEEWKGCEDSPGTDLWEARGSGQATRPRATHNLGDYPVPSRLISLSPSLSPSFSLPSSPLLSSPIPSSPLPSTPLPSHILVLPCRLHSTPFCVANYILHLLSIMLQS
ncbi:hypothetical protein E2C01_093356 [Portunus trituberculatus]|uniref:Uncharacterized protein n=1 Tax=Portunus trituberculatus TaxID=210409 RepID=A0A5B7JXV5_PORTR|nr:hypothetical protein [Portunus trituberculatus]